MDWRIEQVREAGGEKCFLLLHCPQPLPLPALHLLVKASGAFEHELTPTVLSMRFEPFADLSRKERIVQRVLWSLGIVQWSPSTLHDLFPYSTPTEIAEWWGVERTAR